MVSPSIQIGQLFGWIMIFSETFSKPHLLSKIVNKIGWDCSSGSICQIEEDVGCLCFWLDKMLRCGAFFHKKQWWIEPIFVRWQGALDTTLWSKICQGIATQFPLSTLNYHDISVILLKVVLNIIPIPYLPKFFLIKSLWELPIVCSLYKFS